MRPLRVRAGDFALAGLMAASPIVRALVEEQLAEEAAVLRLIAICGPEESAYTQAVLAEVERRWRVHLEHAELGRVAPVSRRAVACSVYRDVCEGWL